MGIGSWGIEKTQQLCWGWWYFQSWNTTNTMEGRLREEAAEEQNKKKQCLATHGTDSVHAVSLFLVPDITLKESNFSITKFLDHIVFPLSLLLKQLFTASVNTLEICSYTAILSGLCLFFFPLFCFFNTRKTVQILIMF